jgi:hypothetical protein
VGPEVVDEETGAKVTLDPVKLTVDVVTDPPGVPVLRVAFDHQWLIRVRQDSGVRTLSYALAPWYFGRHGKIHTDAPPGLIHRPLPLRCEGDPLGSWPSGATSEVPQRVHVPLGDGQWLTLERSRSDGSLWVEWMAARFIDAVGGLGVMIGIPFTIISLTGVDSSPKVGPLHQGQWRAVGLLGGSLLVAGGGFYLEYSAAGQLGLREGSQLAQASEPGRTAPAVRVQGLALSLDPKRGQAGVGLSLAF